ncbi:hypothetical protein FISHEDRAFT_32840 [Fistulina hepatica ATCC 64428]|uniref:C3H1-type domain-containing protein n=1 Tax=Fistulina hepatica ATCC 64428 TaxID=1128425 RepID=A0A0D7APH1_9AGAR|nr:hypothetical protein FISHEDRAFT_32840 [Fistulina hepatica ATCC 64428]
MSIASQQDLRTSSILKTVEILDVINVNAKRAKINLLLSLKVPQFPESQWSKLLSGATVDFDQVLSGVYTSAEIGRTTEHWTTAFDSFAAAFIFIFPHRVDEVRDYSEHIKDFFKARSEHEHGAVIAYDSAVRTRVSQRQDLLLTDSLRFQDLQLRFIFSSAGASSGPGSSNAGGTQRGGKTRRQSREPCRNWNAGRCNRSATSCNYAHICARCRVRGHVEGVCEKD